MNQHSKSAFPGRTHPSTEGNSAIFVSPKREKFLFERSSERKSDYAVGQAAITWRTPPKLVQNDFVMRITIDIDSITELRHIILKTCGDLVLFMRVKPVDHASKMKVWLCLSKSSVDTVIGNIMHVLPQAEFGKVTPLVAV